MINLSDATNENERLTLQLIRAMETGDLPETVKAICTEDFVWTNSGFETVNGQEELWAQMERGGFAAEVPILATMTHFSAELFHMASQSLQRSSRENKWDANQVGGVLKISGRPCDSIVFTERVDHHWDEAGRDLMTPHICGVTEIRDGKISAFRDFFDTICFQQQPTEIQPGFDLETFRQAQANGDA